MPTLSGTARSRMTAFGAPRIVDLDGFHGKTALVVAVIPTHVREGVASLIQTREGRTALLTIREGSGTLIHTREGRR